MAGAAGHIGAGNDAVADLQRPTFAVEDLATRGDDLADILMKSLDDLRAQIGLKYPME